ncbi:MAG: late competence development ComFB family protein [Oscillospiraceae bacterium]|nr:late competence development ComFB family protein [Oscillospiraceae bacterium]
MMQLRNFTEETVRAFLDRLYPTTDICQCEICRLDVTAIMLNGFKPHYVVTEVGALYAQLEGDFDPQYKVDLMSSMAQAVKLVKERPRHDQFPPAE